VAIKSRRLCKVCRACAGFVQAQNGLQTAATSHLCTCAGLSVAPPMRAQARAREPHTPNNALSRVGEMPCTSCTVHKWLVAAVCGVVCACTVPAHPAHIHFVVCDGKNVRVV